MSLLPDTQKEIGSRGQPNLTIPTFKRVRPASVGSGIPIIGTPKPFLHSTLLSDLSVTAPLIGPPGTVTGVITYNSNGADIDANGKHFCFPWVPQPAGTQEMKWKPHFNNNSLQDAFFSCADNPVHTRVLMQWANIKELAAGRAGALAVTSGISFAIDTDIIWRLLWDAAGIEGGSNIHELYRDGLLVATNGTALPAVTQTELRIGNNSLNTLHANAVLKDIKVWNVALRP